ncbi:AraC family transcriptional regulator [Winogradskyella maritima]|uniref:Helix-turn-helix domain-containing protein n=1 Tax=Winogradskyella maritima TaxID=1517766 RepID=A0ABV8AG21_9FLAO|nr:AraC family transcriptional regulator [Winogradskyella maritima]
MKLFVKFDYKTLCNKVLNEVLERHNIEFEVTGFGEVDIKGQLAGEAYDELVAELASYGTSVIENQKTILVEKIKDAVIEMVFEEENQIKVNSSVYLSEKLGHSYGHLANLFSEITYSSIENFIIFQKIEYTKKLIIKENMSLTEIAYKLNYSSVAHLSAQFKKMTGITPSAFQRIIAKRQQITNES